MNSAVKQPLPPDDVSKVLSKMRVLSGETPNDAVRMSVGPAAQPEPTPSPPAAPADASPRKGTYAVTTRMPWQLHHALDDIARSNRRAETGEADSLQSIVIEATEQWLARRQKRQAA